MANLRSVTAGGTDWAKDVATEWYPRFAKNFPLKFYWFISKGYVPHEWQAAFHAASKPDGTLCRFRHLVAGRRGGKTLSAAWEVLFYCLFPEQFRIDYPGTGRNKDKPLWVWVLAKDHVMGDASREAFREVLNQAGLVPNQDYKWNKTEKRVEFPNGSRLQFKTAEDPQNLRGAGLDILWIDESAQIPTDEAYIVSRPALSDKLGLIITTTTPRGKNWFYEEFWSERIMDDPNHFRVEYTFIDNPYNLREEWEWAKHHYPAIYFKQEYMAAFDAMQGIDLDGGWLHYYVYGKPDKQSDEVGLPRNESGQIKLRKFIGVDPAVSLSDRADFFAMALIGISPDGDRAFLLKTLKDRLSFPDQIDVIKTWFREHRPEYIGVEANAFQKWLAQQVARIEGLPPIHPVINRGKKADRILAMGPVFKLGTVRIHSTHHDFVEEWINYDSTIKNPQDDLLDATEIALSAAGVLLPTMDFAEPDKRPKTLDEEAWAHIAASKANSKPYDPELGSEA